MFEVDFHILNQKATPAIYADTLALRPAAGFAGRLFVATDSPYGVFRDTGTAWVQVAGSGGGTGSTGVNGLNGTTNIGLGGTLANNTTIAQNANNITFSKTGSETFNVNSFYNFDYTDVSNYRHLIQPNGSGALNLFLGNTTLSKSSLLQIHEDRIKTFFNGTGEYGLLLNNNIGKFALGDYGNDRKYNSFVINDDDNTFYLTTSFNQSNTDQDLFFASNASAGVRFVKLGDFNNYFNGNSFIIDDANNFIKTTNNNGDNGFIITNSYTQLGQNNPITSLFLTIDYGSNLISTYSGGIANGLDFDFTSLNYRIGNFNGNNYIQIQDSNNFIEFLTSEIKYTGAALEDPTPGITATKALLITLNGFQYKINLY